MWFGLLDQAAHQLRRVQSRLRNVEVRNCTYISLGEPPGSGCRAVRHYVAGLSCGQYEACPEAVPDMFGLSALRVSRWFIRANVQVLKVFSERRLEQKWRDRTRPRRQGFCLIVI